MIDDELARPLPDTKLVREALGIATRALPLPLLRHSLRAYLLGEAYATATGRAHDQEDLCLAALFHDVGLTPEHRRAGLPFTFGGSNALARFLEERDVAAERVAPLVDAIDFHLQLLPRWSKGNVAGLLQVGAWMDVYGLRRRTVAREAARVAALLPREGFTGLFHRNLVSTLRSPSACLGLLFPASFRARAQLAA
jgi:HD domain